MSHEVPPSSIPVPTEHTAVNKVNQDQAARSSSSSDNDQLIKVLQSGFFDLQKAVEALKAPMPVADKKSTFWTSYMKLADEHDKEFKEKYVTDLDTALIFAGLFSAVGSAFIIQIEPQLTGNPSAKIVVAESLLYISLSTTLLVALVAVLGKQWLMYYHAAGSRGTIEERGLERQRKLDGLHKWKFDTVMQTLPLLLQLALLLFSTALSVYLWTVNIPIAIIVLTFTLVGFGAYLVLLSSATISPDLPFQTPLAPLFKRTISLTHIFLEKLIGFLFRQLIWNLKVLRFGKPRAYLLESQRSSRRYEKMIEEELLVEELPETIFDKPSAEVPAVLMAFDPDHHQPARQGSPAPVVGAVRPRPTDATISSESDEGSPTPDVTRSPHTRRVVQRRRTQPGQPELEALRYSADTDLDTPAPVDAAPSAAAVGSGTAPVAWPPEHSPLLAALESLLARAVATTTALQLEGEEIPPYPPTILALVRTLCQRVNLMPPTSTPTFASVAATALTTPVDPRSNTSPPATAHHGTRTEPLSPPLAPPRTAGPLPAPPKKRQPRRRTRQRSLHRAIYRWLGAPPLSEERPSEADIVEALEGVVSEGSSAPRIHGVSWTPAGHLAIHTRSPFLATQLLPFFPRIDTAIKRHTTRLEGRCVLDVDIPWTWVVLHGVPAKAFWEVMDNEGHGIWTELTSQGYGEEVLTYHPMLKSGRGRDDEDHLSIKLAFTEEGSAKRLLAQSGVFLFGAHCRAVKYRP
ncbi:hypothetical protein GGX14DRAFT_624913 [Mycena pura]|uniref:DUF6535 domain-containing protein n=1 Tax=Mycena pura TaxID=153505 RepID=A0AAD6VF19_9AGAR|nr:hypothetical protein GGX14DRAFT_624913 [Mycena pura]